MWKNEVAHWTLLLSSTWKQYVHAHPVCGTNEEIADIIVPEGGKNMVAMDIIKAKIQVLLQELYDDKAIRVTMIPLY